jgi:hypothetical protein
MTVEATSAATRELRGRFADIIDEGLPTGTVRMLSQTDESIMISPRTSTARHPARSNLIKIGDVFSPWVAIRFSSRCR